MALASPRFDIARFGAEAPRFSPRQADLLWVVGTISQRQAPVLKRIYEQMTEPKWVLAFGTCASCGGFYDNYTTVAGHRQNHPVRRLRPRLSAAPRGGARRPHAPPGQDPRAAIATRRASSSRATDPRRLVQARAARQLGSEAEARGMSQTRPRARSRRSSAPPIARDALAVRRRHRRRRRRRAGTRSRASSATTRAATSTCSSTSAASTIPNARAALRGRAAPLLDVASSHRVRLKTRVGDEDGRRRRARHASSTVWAGAELVRARDLRHDRHRLHGPPRSAPHPDVPGVRRAPAPQGLPGATRRSRSSRTAPKTRPACRSTSSRRSAPTRACRFGRQTHDVDRRRPERRDEAN